MPQNRKGKRMIEEIFPKPKLKSLESMQSYAVFRQSGSSDDSEPREYDLPSKRSLSKSQSLRMAKSGQSVARLSNNLKRRSGHKSPSSAHVKHKMYAGIIHSDLDIQTHRPPYMHLMHVLEWFWLQSTIRHRIIIMILAFLATTAILNSLFAIWVIAISKNQDPNLCTSKACRNLGKRLKSSLNTSVNPCDDFYAFVCGQSGIHQVSEIENRHWKHGRDLGRIFYDFHHSKSLGAMLKPTKKHPESLILPFYKACLNENARDAAGLQPYYDLLKELKLYNIDTTMNFKSEDVIDSMARILSYTLPTTALLNVVFYKDEATGTIKSYVTPMLTLRIKTGTVSRYGYPTYYNTIKDALTMVATELKISQQELDILPHDIICLELFYRDGYFAMDDVLDPITEERPPGKACEISKSWNVTTQGEPKANFGKTKNTAFDFELLRQKLFNLSSPPPGSPVPELDLTSFTSSTFLDAFKHAFEISAPIRLLRYLQWRLLYLLTLDLNHEPVQRILLPVKRHYYLGRVENCFTQLFTLLPFIVPNRFLEGFSQKGLHAIEEKFDDLNDQIRDTYRDLVDHYTFNEMKRIVGATIVTDDNVKILKGILKTALEVKIISPVDFTNEKFKNYAKLYTNIKFDKHQHVKNILTIGRRSFLWKTSPDFYSSYYGIDSTYHVPVWIDRFRTSFNPSKNEFRIYMPLGSIEVPFLNDGLTVSDAGGLGMTIGIPHQQLIFLNLFPNPTLGYKFIHKTIKPTLDSLNIPEPSQLQKIETLVVAFNQYVEFLRNEFNRQRLTYWKTGNLLWDKIVFQKSSVKYMLDAILVDSSRNYIMTQMVNNYLKDPRNKREKNYILEGLEKYNSKQIYYISLVNRNCMILPQKKFDHYYKYGPLVQPLQNNVILSNLHDFAKTFKCPVGSPMNLVDHIHFWEDE